MQRITSRQNAVVARYRDAARGAADQTLLLDGAHLVGEALAADIRLLHLLVSAGALDTSEVADVVSAARARGIEPAVGSSSVMAAASPVRSSSAIVALAERPLPPRSPYAGPLPLVVIACDVQDPGNLGAIVRVAEAAGASAVVAAGMSADPFGWKALRGSMGSALRLPVTTTISVDDAVRGAREHGVRIVATVPHGGEPLFDDGRLAGPAALLIGGEGPGLPANVIRNADSRITIPMKPPVESLNAAVAAAILLYEAHRQRSHASGTKTLRAVSTRR